MGALVYLCGVYVVYVARVVDDVCVGWVMPLCTWSVLSIGVCGVYKCVGYACSMRCEAYMGCGAGVHGMCA